MRIEDFTMTDHATEYANIEVALMRRNQSGFNEFWLSHGDDKYPAISVLVSGDLASLHYFPREGHPGLSSVGKVQGLKSDGSTKFFINDGTEELEVSNDSIVPFSLALKAAHEFAISNSAPRSIQWFEL
jgi:Immunity protein Imm1